MPKAKSQEEGSQIDLLFDRLDGSITLCEIKHFDKPFAKDGSVQETHEDKETPLLLYDHENGLKTYDVF